MRIGNGRSTISTVCCIKTDPAPHPLPGWTAREIVGRHLASPSMLCVLGIQDWMSIDERLRLADANAERINVPANPKHYWRYRMHIGIEELMKANDFNHNITDLIAQSGDKEPMSNGTQMDASHCSYIATNKSRYEQIEVVGRGAVFSRLGDGTDRRRK